MAGSTTECAADGPVLNLINKRLRALRKKHNRIIQMEESVAQGKPLNKEQEEVLRSKPSVVASIDELEKLRQPLSVAVSEEIDLAAHRLREESSSVSDTVPPAEKNGEVEEGKESKVDVDSVVGDLLNLLYFGAMFDVKSQHEFTATMLTRNHERGCCLTYDYVTDDATNLLSEKDLDLISSLSGLLVSRPVDSSLSHKNALQRCVEHAKMWLANSDESLDSSANVSYAGLRERLNKIMASDYFTTTPEMKLPGEVAAAAAGNFGSFPVQVESHGVEYQQQHEDAANLQGQEFSEQQPNPAEEPHMDEPKMENPEEMNPSQQEDTKASPQSEHNQRDTDSTEQQYSNRRNYQQQRGGGGGGGRGTGSGGRRGYSNGRGGRGSGYSNGRGQYHDQSANYYPRTYYGNRGRAGGRGGYHSSAGVSAADLGATS